MERILPQSESIGKQLSSPPKILMACSNAWNSTFQVGSHHLAREFLSLGWEVAYISDPISPFHLLRRGEGLKKRYQIYREEQEQERFWTYVPAAFLTPHNQPLLRTDWVYRNWHRLTVPSLIRKVREKGFSEVDLLYFDTPIQSFWLKELRARKTVFRIPDQNRGFKKTTPAFLKLEEELIEQADLVVCTAKTLVDSVQGKAKRVEYLPNGVPFSHFSIPQPIPSEMEKIQKPIAIYVGAIDDWFDSPLVKKIALDLPHISFVLIGPLEKNPFQGIPNIHVLGARPYSAVPAYLQHADAGLIPFDVEHYPDLIHSVNPLKLYEYMASGLPVVAARWLELEQIGSPAFLCSGPEEFKTSLLKALENPNPDRYRTYAARLDWSSRAAQLLAFLGMEGSFPDEP